MKRENLAQYIAWKFKSLNSSDQTLKSIYEISFDQQDRIFCEYLDNFMIANFTYSDFSIYTKKFANYLNNKIKEPKHNYVGLLMDNSMNWVAIFWALLMIGYKPFLLNKKLPIEMLKEMVSTMKINTVVADSHVEKNFNNILFINNENKPLSEVTNLEPLQELDWEDEIALSTTATTLSYKICIFTGKELHAQMSNAKCVLERNKMIKEHYNGRLKVLAFLPFYHIFGLIAAYFWFSLFGRTFVFLKDYSSETILKTCQRHKVTHIFGVPLLWDTIAREVKKEINALPEKDKKKANKGLNFTYHLQNVFPNYGRHKCRKLLARIQNKLFGDSVIFCISGGGPVSNETLYLINAIGYPLYNGYGSTEIGITSVELRSKPKYRLLGTIGKPLDTISYKIEDDELLVKGSSICHKIINRDGTEVVINKDEWQHTYDVASVDKNGYYYLRGRKDDVYLGKNGEKINPDEIEKLILLTSAIRYCFTTYQDKLTLIIQLSKSNYTIRANTIIEEVNNCVNKLDKCGYHIEQIYYTFDDIASKEAIKVSRKILEKLISSNKIKLLNFSEFTKSVDTDSENINNEIINRIKKVFGEVLNKDPDTLDINAHFFFDLGGSSLDYMSLLAKLEQEFEMKISLEEESCSTINSFYKYIVGKGN